MTKVVAVAFSGGGFHTGHVARMTNFLRMRPDGYEAKLVVVNSLETIPTVHKYDFERELLNMNPDLPDELALTYRINAESPDIVVFDCLNAIPKLKDGFAQNTFTVIFDDDTATARKAQLVVNAILGNWKIPERIMRNGHVLLTSPHYLVLNPDLKEVRRNRLPIDDELHSDISVRPFYPNLLIALGGTDPARKTRQLLEGVMIIQNLKTRDQTKYRGFNEVLVLVSPSHPDYKEIQNIAEKIGAKLDYGVDMVEAIAKSEVAFTGGGLTAFEAIGAGLGVIVFPNDNHELITAKHLIDSFSCLGILKKYDTESFAVLINIFLTEMFEDPRTEFGMRLVDLDGGKRVWQQIRDIYE
jgi:spore coat polysaccharide biosynthesis predicted glycosyltransferase SpsG